METTIFDRAPYSRCIACAVPYTDPSHPGRGGWGTCPHHQRLYTGSLSPYANDPKRDPALRYGKVREGRFHADFREYLERQIMAKVVNHRYAVALEHGYAGDGSAPSWMYREAVEQAMVP